MTIYPTPEFVEKLIQLDESSVQSVSNVLKQIQELGLEKILKNSVFIESENETGIWAVTDNNATVLYSIGEKDSEQQILLVDVLGRPKKRILQESSSRDPRVNQNLNPNINRTLNPTWNRQLNPIWNRSINPIWNRALSPIWNRTISPIWNHSLSPVWNRTLNPVWNRKLNLGSNSSVTLRSPESNFDAIFYDLSLKPLQFLVQANKVSFAAFDTNGILVGYFHRCSEAALILYDSQGVNCGLAIFASNGVYLVYENNQWIGTLIMKDPQG